MKILDDGTVVQDGLNFQERGDRPGKKVGQILYPVKAQVLAVYEIDTTDNRDGETTVCDLYVSSLGIPLFKVPFGLNKASVDNYIHSGPVEVTGYVDQSSFDATRIDPKKSNGDTVVVLFIDGDVQQPIIIAMAPHNQSGFDGVCPDPRPGSEDGDISKTRINGTRFQIDKNGNVEFTSDFPALDPNVSRNKKFTVRFTDPAKLQLVEFIVDNSLGSPVVTTEVRAENGTIQTSVLDGAAESVALTNQNSAGTNSILMNNAGITLTTPVKTIINSTGDVDVNTQGKVVVIATGDADVTTQGNANVTATGNAVVTAAEIQLNGSTGEVLTDKTDPVIDTIYGAPTVGVPTVKAG